MTRVLLALGAAGLSFEATGHAGYAESGADIVCAAVSMLAQAFLQAVSEDAATKLEQADVRPGALRFSATGGERLDAMAAFAAAGFRLLAGRYPEYVSFVEQQKGP